MITCQAASSASTWGESSIRGMMWFCDVGGIVMWTMGKFCVTMTMTVTVRILRSVEYEYAMYCNGEQDRGDLAWGFQGARRDEDYKRARYIERGTREYSLY